MRENDNDHILEFRASIPPLIEGSRFIKSISVGLPFVKMKLNVITRKIYPIPLTHEIVLRLIEEKWTNYDQIRELLGVDQDYFDNILLELGESDYIIHLGKQLALSEIGRRVLVDLKSIRIEPDFMENVYVNMLTGNIIIEDGPATFRYKEKVKCEIYLNNKQDLSGNFLVNHEHEIRELYNKRVFEDRSRISSDDTIGEDELYRVVSIEDYDQVYEEVLTHVYYSDESDELVYQLVNEYAINNELFYSCFKDQLREHPKSFDGIYNTKDYSKLKDTKAYSWYNDEIYSSHDLETKRNELILQLMNKNVQLDQTYNCYYTDRLLLFREYQEILKKLPQQKPSEVVIITDQFYSLQKSEYSLLVLLEALSQKTKLFIGYSSSSKSIIPKIKQKNIKDVRFKEFTDIRGIRIIVDREYMMSINFQPLRIGREVILEEISVLTYDQSQIDLIRGYFSELFIQEPTDNKTVPQKK